MVRERLPWDDQGKHANKGVSYVWTWVQIGRKLAESGYRGENFRS